VLPDREMVAAGGSKFVRGSLARVVLSVLTETRTACC
jgi:hypothetical protein